MDGRKRSLGVACVFALLITMIDQVVKRLVVGGLSLGESQPLIPGLLNLSYRQNTGAAFSLFRNAPSLTLVLINLLVLGIFLALIYPHVQRRSGLLAAALVLGGALGNLYDRMMRGYVVDYLDIHVWPVFNLADMCIVFGVVALALTIFAAERQHTATPGGDRS